MFYPKQEQEREGSGGDLTCSHTAQNEDQQQQPECSHVPLSEGAGSSGPWATSCRGLQFSPAPAWTNDLHTVR